ncbi:PH domain-containing protein [Chloropicon roscoffensis]|uniref:PH domain-containing protein n=1 Tax=Chloropicon roscoffensis TaxID=1461544 RepID=A0AAX4PGC9_9CHLO
MRGSKSNFEHVMVTVVWGKLFVQAAPKSKTAQDGCIHQPEKAFSLVNGSLAVDVDGSGRIDVVTPTHRLQFLVELSSELSHDKWLKVLAQCISIYDLDNKYFIDFGEMVRRQTKGKQAAPATAGGTAEQRRGPGRSLTLRGPRPGRGGHPGEKDEVGHRALRPREHERGDHARQALFAQLLSGPAAPKGLPGEYLREGEERAGPVPGGAAPGPT